MEQLNLFEAAGMDADTGLPTVTFTKQELINLYKEILTKMSYSRYLYHSPDGMLPDTSGNEFLSYILKSK